MITQNILDWLRSQVVDNSNVFLEIEVIMAMLYRGKHLVILLLSRNTWKAEHIFNDIMTLAKEILIRKLLDEIVFY